MSIGNLCYLAAVIFFILGIVSLLGLWTVPTLGTVGLFVVAVIFAVVAYFLGRRPVV